MPRIPDALLDRIKHEVALDALVRSSGVELRKLGGNLVGLCPFHEDRETPNLHVTPEKGMWRCFACQAGGTAIDWIMRKEGVDFREAALRLAKDFFPDEARDVERPLSRARQRALSCPLDQGADDAELVRQVVAYYHEALKESPEAKSYLERRGLLHAEALGVFKLGYANRTLGMRITAKLRERLQTLGWFRETGHEHHTGAVIVPILGEEGEVLGAYSRKLLSNLRSGTPKHLYLPGPHRGVFNLEGIRDQKEVILCEALLDALTFWCAGFKNVTSSYGVEGFTHDHLAAFKAFGVEHVLVAYDRDDAGDRAADALSKKLTAEGIATSRVQFPKGMDANEYALKVKPPEKALGVLVRAAEWMGGGSSARSARAERPQLPERHASAGLSMRVAPRVVAPEAAKGRAAVAMRPEPGASDGTQAAEEKKPASPDLTPEQIDEVSVPVGDRTYRLRGLRKNLSWGILKLNVLVRREGPEAEALFAPPSPLAGFFVDTLDLYSARQRAAFEKQAASDLGVTEETVRRDLGQVLKRAEELQHETIRKALEPKTRTPEMTDEEREEALVLLKDRALLERILADFDACGLVGEETNKLTAYLAATSRKLDRPLAVIVQSSSAAGKSALMEAVLAFMPEEEREKYSALTGMSLFYFGEDKSLRHKILAIAEEEGAERATYALKLLQSEGELSIASTGKDPQTGRLVTQEYRVEGPVMIFLTTTAVEIDEELLNRCLVLTVDESREQTRRIHDLQRHASTLDGILASKRRPKALRVHKNAQRLLRPLAVHNPYADRLTFLDEKTRTRRDHVKYLKLIESIALLHQHQRQVKEAMAEDGELVEYVEVTLSDVATANRLASEVLGRSLDELPPQTRRLLLALDEMVTATCEKQGLRREDLRFSRRDARVFTGWHNTQLSLHLARLVELEYLLVHRGGRGQSFVYELLYAGEGKDGSRFLPCLIDADSLAPTDALAAGPLSSGTDPATTASFRGEEGEFPGSFRAHSAPFPGGFRGEETSPEPAPRTGFNGFPHENTETSLLGPVTSDASYVVPLARPLSPLNRAGADAFKER